MEAFQERASAPAQTHTIRLKPHFYGSCYPSQMLEVQLAEIIRQGFSQCPTVGSQLRLLEVFEGISSRELVQDNLRDKDKMLVQGFTSELSHVKTMFQYLAKSPPLHKNMPTVVSKIQWVHALRQRIQVGYVLGSFAVAVLEFFCMFVGVHSNSIQC